MDFKLVRSPRRAVRWAAMQGFDMCGRPRCSFLPPGAGGNHVARPHKLEGSVAQLSPRRSSAAATAAASTNVFGQYIAAAVIDVVQGKIDR